MRRDERITLGKVLGVIDRRREELQNRTHTHTNEMELLKARNLIKDEFDIKTETQVSLLKTESRIVK